MANFPNVKTRWFQFWQRPSSVSWSLCLHHNGFFSSFHPSITRTKKLHDEFWLLHKMFTIDHLFLLLVTKRRKFVWGINCSCYHRLPVNRYSSTHAHKWLNYSWLLDSHSLVCPKYALHFHWCYSFDRRSVIALC